MAYYSTVTQFVLEKSVFSLGTSTIYDGVVINGDSRHDIHIYAGFGYLIGPTNNRRVNFLSYEWDIIGSPTPGERITPFGSVKCTQDVLDAAKSYNVRFYMVSGHEDPAGNFITDSYKYKIVTFNQPVIPPLGMVEELSVRPNTVKINESVHTLGRIRNGGGDGNIKWEIGIGYRDNYNIIFLDSQSGIKNMMGGELLLFDKEFEITKEMYDVENSNNDVRAYLTAEGI